MKTTLRDMVKATEQKKATKRARAAREVRDGA